MPTIEWVGSKNFSSRAGNTPCAIVDHITSGSYPGCLKWMQNPISQASATYLVLKDGRILQLVKERDKAWANGIVNKPNWSLYSGFNPNLYTISIEHEGMSGDVMPDAQYQSSLWLHKDIIARWKMPIDENHIIGHYRINSVDKANCPGSGFPWDRLFKDLKGGNDMLDVAVLLNTTDDFWSGVDVAAKHGNCAMFVRPCTNANTRKLIVVGGSTTGHPNEVLLSGKTKYDTAAAVKKYLG